MLPDQNHGFNHGICICFPARALNQLNEETTMINAKTNARRTTKNDSLKNWPINWDLIDPIDLRMPTSFALFSERAVLRFMKLIHAKINTITPTTPNSHTV